MQSFGSPTAKSGRYKYKYKYRPHVRIYRDGGKHLMEVDGMSESVQVRRASIVAEGSIVSDFRGFNGGSRFEFGDGTLWEQAEYKYAYHYAYRPHAHIIDGAGGLVLQVDGMSETVQVRRVR